MSRGLIGRDFFVFISVLHVHTTISSGVSFVPCGSVVASFVVPGWYTNGSLSGAVGLECGSQWFFRGFYRRKISLHHHSYFFGENNGCIRTAIFMSSSPDFYREEHVVRRELDGDVVVNG